MAKRMNVSAGVLAMLIVAAALPVAAAFGFSSAPFGGLQCRQSALRSTCTSRRVPALRASIRMDRKDGGAGKVSKPGGGGGLGGGPGQGAGDGGAMDQERGGAGVAVLTKPPDVDKVSFLVMVASLARCCCL